MNYEFLEDENCSYRGKERQIITYCVYVIQERLSSIYTYNIGLVFIWF